MWIKLNTGEVVERPYREAVRLVSRRLADPTLPSKADETPADDTPPANEPSSAPAVDQATGDDGDAPVPSGDVAAYEAAYSKDELVELAKTNDLPTSGNKGELVARLLDANVELSTGEAPAPSGATPEDVPGENVSSPDEQA